ncbi:NAC transcription factor 56-like [Punica granatum]|uniref:NAC domain-containing protein n=2 Tax=Punica granatum TaxID=22663 RepID=A0A218Y3Q2_PUNGR|nr:NAC transcription factor 56-like [Punica granatum]OWM91182.1 hypothetical protein CDL15_Pgr000125 [Punica granatum]PKI55392.1 hypothetical protein CRG98_024243 [Punica granatum]
MEPSIWEVDTLSAPLALPGFRFQPTDQELIVHYLREKVSASCSSSALCVIADVDIYKHDPWELPGKAVFGEDEWFFFSPRNRKYPNGARPNRAAASGYWKATGIDKPILNSNGSQCLGVKKALVFYRGRPPKGSKTDWMMHEYRLIDDHHLQYSRRLRGSMLLDDWVLCRVRRKASNSRNGINSSSVHQFTSNGSIQGQDQISITENFSSSIISNDQLQFGQSPELSTSQINSTFDAALESIWNILSIGALDELVPVSP